MYQITPSDISITWNEKEILSIFIFFEVRIRFHINNFSEGEAVSPISQESL